MIISQTPFRISFVGGGTDIPSFYKNCGGGAVVSTTIDKYIYVTVKPQNRLYEHRFRIGYSVTENVDSVEQINNPIVREAFKLLDIEDPMEITVLSEIPARTGLGSSSSFAVGLLNALHAFKGKAATPEQLAREACQIEIDRLNRPIGKQDHYAAAYGGLNRIQFDADEFVRVEPILCNLEKRDAFFSHLLLFYTGITRDAGDVLKSQQSRANHNQKRLGKMTQLVEPFVAELQFPDGELSRLGKLLHQGWKYKQSLAQSITSPEIDEYYEKAMSSGSTGGKLLGAGGGGFLLLFAEPSKQESVRRAIGELMELPIEYEPYGSRIVFVR